MSRDAGTAFADLATYLQEELARAAEELRDEMMGIAFDQSSGPYSLAALAMFGHPYSRIHPNPAFDPGTINVQTGEFRAAWRHEIADQGDAVEVAIWNEDPKGTAYLEHGTMLMVARPVKERIVAALGDTPEKLQERAIETALQRATRR